MINIFSSYPTSCESVKHKIDIEVKTNIPHRVKALKPVGDSEYMYILLVERMDKEEWIVWGYHSEDCSVYAGEYFRSLNKALESFAVRGLL